MKKHKLSSFLRWTTRNSLQAMLLATTLSLLAGCSADGDSRRNSLPQGKYPLTFSTAVEGLSVTRAATAEGVWTVDDPVTVRVGGVAKKYKPASGNPSTTLQAADGVAPFYWQSASETKTVSAWYLGTGYQEELSATWRWTVQTDQNANAAAGYQQSDFLYAPETSISFADRSKASLTFHHQTAKVVINILNAEAVTSADQIAAVSLVNMRTTGIYNAPQSPNTAGTWTPDGTMRNIITPKSLALAPGTAGNILKSYAALVIPQHMGGMPFIKVTAHGNDYYYTPPIGEAKLLSGQQYTYNITVKHGYLEVVAVSEDGGAWSEDGVGEEIQSKSLAVGDFYMKDGSLISGSTETLTEEQKANCIGIVFWVGDPTAQDKTLKADHPNCTHGLVVALKEAIDTPEGTTKWQEPANSVQKWLDSNRPGQFLNVESDIGSSDPWHNIQGYNNTKAIEEYNNNSGLSLALPVVAVVDYRKNAAAIAPVHSSDWYLPSAKELALLCGDVIDIENAIKNDTRDLLNGTEQTPGQFDKLGDYAEDYNGNYWSSTASPAYFSTKPSGMYVMFFKARSRIAGDYAKSNSFRVRFILAF